MTNATLKMGNGKNCWDTLALMIQSDSCVVPLIHFKDRYDALDVFRQLSIAFFDDFAGDLTFTANGRMVTLQHDEWTAALSCMDQWFDEYTMITEDASYY